MGYIKINITKHIAPKLFFPHELQKNREIDIFEQNHVTILHICSLSLYQQSHFKNALMALV
jgi:hypothetical protein